MDFHDSFISNDNHESIESCKSSPQSSPPSFSKTFLEPTAVSSVARPPSVNGDIQSKVVSIDETLEDPVVEVISNLLSPSSNPARLEEVHHDLNSNAVPQQCLQDDDLNERSNVDMNIPTAPTPASPITSSVNFTLPYIPMTPASSPILEGLSRYMTLPGSDAPGLGLGENSGVNLDKVFTPVQRETSARVSTLEPPSESPRIGLLSSTSGNSRSLKSGCSQPASDSLESSDGSQSTPGSNIDNPIRPDLLHPHLHVQIPDSSLGLSHTGPSPSQRMHLGLLHLIPTLFAIGER